MKGLLLTLASILTINVYGKDYFVEDFGVRGDHVTLNTRSIQTAIDYVSENGGGRLIFHRQLCNRICLYKSQCYAAFRGRLHHMGFHQSL